MDEKDIAEQAYKNGYEQALKDIRSDLSDEAIVKVLEERVNYINEEFERTKTPINFMMIGVDAVVVCDTLDFIHRLQAENERLKIDLENEKNWRKIQTKQLQKQVDELTKENERLKDLEFTQEHCNLYEENKWLRVELQHQLKKVEQAVKDRAKEILQTINRAKEKGQIYYNEDFMITAQKAYGVEVE